MRGAPRWDSRGHPDGARGDGVEDLGDEETTVSVEIPEDQEVGELLVADDTLEAICRSGRGGRAVMVALTDRERSNDFRTYVRHDDDSRRSSCERVDGEGVGITYPEFMHHIELLEYDVRFHRMAPTAAPGAGSQETEAFEWLMGRMRRMILSWSLMVVDVRLRVRWTPKV